jgi:tetratricopeptide (TPR) repeat protein
MLRLPELRMSFLGAILLLGCVSVISPARVLSQGGSNVVELTQKLRAQISAAEAQKAGDSVLGDLWWKLGIAYQSQLAHAAAEDAYVRALPLLRAAGLDAKYADALHGLGTVCLSTGRHAEARKYLAAALANYEKLQDVVAAVHVRQAIGLEVMSTAKYKDAIAEFSGSLAQVSALPNPPAEAIIAGYLLRSTAEYRHGESTEALADVALARAAAAGAKLPPNSLASIDMLLAEGAALTRLGRPDGGDAAIQEALRLATKRNDLAPAASVALKLGILREYLASLQAVHRKQDAKRTEAQMAQLRSELPARCETCTVSVAALRSTAPR